jgi:hypothetical protein
MKYQAQRVSGIPGCFKRAGIENPRWELFYIL